MTRASVEAGVRRGKSGLDLLVWNQSHGNQPAQMKLSEMAVISLSRVVKIDSVEGAERDWSTANAPAPIFAAIVCKAATGSQKRGGSLSPSSNDNKATGRWHTCPAVGARDGDHSLTRVVLPNPAEAEMRVCLRPPPGLIQPLHQARARDNSRPGRGKVELGG